MITEHSKHELNTITDMLYSLKNVIYSPPPSHNGHLSTTVSFFCPRPRWSLWRGSTEHSNSFKTHAARNNNFSGCPNTLKQVNMLMKWEWKSYAGKGKYILLTALGHHKWNGYERFTPWKTFKFHYHYPVNSFLICLCRLMFHNFHNTQTVHWLSFKHAWYHQYSDCKSNIQRATYLLP